ncbi:DUF1338-domain-containing protein [Trichocladium antarcticum]|uniref:2-oxoadipate dioxygenase/decarboxylase n=1 Tax=Trichocladium antarcticum TaxID=1450529 RepID=A0AAN6UH07_9PEZI|nr:DUF1338-domain-containing protein [Trichocladium antarcticum]
MPPRWDADQLRTEFVRALSDMYRTEVPLYGQLVDIVRTVDNAVLAARGQTPDNLPTRHQLERHGAIRLGTEHEMRTTSRLFAVMGMYPVGYYDLGMAGFPLHGTAFRPTSESSLRKNPFRVFTTVLRPDLIPSPAVRQTATSLLASRALFTPRLCALISQAEDPATRRHLTADDAAALIADALAVFRWHSRATVSLDTYLALRAAHPIVADIVCFPSAHINHLTPRTLDIDAVQAAMIAQGLPAKARIEGPPRGRRCEILLRQTSFTALEERVAFADGGSGSGSGSGSDGAAGPPPSGHAGVSGTHTARFGEVEQRGAAVTGKGRGLYDRLLAEAVAAHGEAGGELDEVLAETFRREYPDDWTELRSRGLVYFRYRVAPDGAAGKLDAILRDVRASQSPVRLEQLLQSGVVECEPITYEDFLPFSAAGIFASNLGGGAADEGAATKLQETEQSNSRAELEGLLGCAIPSEIDLYEELQAASVRECEEALGLKEILQSA